MKVRTSLLALILLSAPAAARDPSKWSTDAVIQRWFQSLTAPDTQLSCCGETDSFEADDYDVEGDHYVAIITDGFGVWPNGTRVSIPNGKLLLNKSNPTGHGQLFLRTGTTEVYCYTPPTSG